MRRFGDSRFGAEWTGRTKTLSLIRTRRRSLWGVKGEEAKDVSRDQLNIGFKGPDKDHGTYRTDFRVKSREVSYLMYVSYDHSGCCMGNRMKVETGWLVSKKAGWLWVAVEHRKVGRLGVYFKSIANKLGVGNLKERNQGLFWWG